jgi:hypothetical protein
MFIPENMGLSPSKTQGDSFMRTGLTLHVDPKLFLTFSRAQGIGFPGSARVQPM